MHLQCKALYNLLRSNWLHDPTLQVKPWQVEDYRVLTEEEIYQRLKNLKIVLDRKRFYAFAANCDTPEDLADFLWLNENDMDGHDEAYLNIFELWRRYFSDTTAISIFCDELDDRINQFFEGTSSSGDGLEIILKDLEDLLDEQIDLGLKPKEAFAILSEYLANDLQNFLYEYITAFLDNDNTLYASELLDGFYDYMDEKKWFDFLRARLIFSTDQEKGSSLFSKILEDLNEENIDLLFEILTFFADGKDTSLFLQAALQTLGALQTREDFLELLELVSKFYSNMGETTFTTQCNELINSQNSSHPLDKNAKDFLTVQEALSRDLNSCK